MNKLSHAFDSNSSYNKEIRQLKTVEERKKASSQIVENESYSKNLEKIPQEDTKKQLTIAENAWFREKKDMEKKHKEEILRLTERLTDDCRTLLKENVKLKEENNKLKAENWVLKKK